MNRANIDHNLSVKRVVFNSTWYRIKIELHSFRFESRKNEWKSKVRIKKNANGNDVEMKWKRKLKKKSEINELKGITQNYRQIKWKFSPKFGKSFLPEQMFQQKGKTFDILFMPFLLPTFQSVQMQNIANDSNVLLGIGICAMLWFIRTTRNMKWLPRSMLYLIIFQCGRFENNFFIEFSDK